MTTPSPARTSILGSPASPLRFVTAASLFDGHDAAIHIMRRMIQDPYPTYARLRARSPVHRSRLLGAWVFTRYADVEAILRDHRRFSNVPTSRRATGRPGSFTPPRADWTMLFLDPPEHTRLRALVNQAVTPRAVNALEPHIRTVGGQLLDAVDPAGFDLMAALANPLPVIVIGMLLISLVESLLNLPGHLSHLPGPEARPVNIVERFFAAVQGAVEIGLQRFTEGPLHRALVFATAQPLTVIAGAIGALVLSVSLLPAGIVQTTFADIV